MQTHTPGAWGKCCLCFTIGSAPTCLLVFLGLERMFFTCSQQRECYQALLWEETTQINGTGLN